MSHTQYGDGTITLVNEYHTRITFDAHGERTFVSSRVVLTPATTEAPPPKPKRARAKTAKAAK